MKLKTKIALGTGVAAAALLVVGTFAWFSTTDRVENEFGLDPFDVIITEDFDTQDVPLTPGTDITKDVTVTNQGDMDVLVRVKLEELLSLLEMDTTEGTDKLLVTYETDAGKTDPYIPATLDEKMITAYTNSGYTAYTTSAPDGVTILQKETKAVVDGKDANTVYSYVAYVTDTKQLVKVTPETYTQVDGKDDKKQPATFKVEYAYHTRKPVDAEATDKVYSLTVQHDNNAENGGDSKLTAYAGLTGEAKFHDDVIKLIFGNSVDYGQTGAPANAKWKYINGYFYYTEVLKGNSISDSLLEAVTLSDKMGNTLRGGRYVLTPIMEAVQVNKEAVAQSWTDVASNNEAKTLVEGIIDTANPTT